MGSVCVGSISHAVPGRRRSTQFTEIGRDEGVNRPARDVGHELEPHRRDRGGAGLSMQSRTNYSYESIQCAPGHVVSGGQWGTIV